MDSKEQELRDKIRPIMEGMVFQLVCDKPENPVHNVSNLIGCLHDKLASERRWLHFKR